LKREIEMRAALLLAGAALTVALSGLPASAQQGGYPLYPWCAYYGGGGRGGGTNCYFSTWDQCRQAISGMGGMCGVNPFYEAYGSWYSFGGSAPRRARRKDRRG
jgi:hypothetical protein